VVCLQEVETRSLRSRLAYRALSAEETQLESFMGELEIAVDKAGRPFRYEAFYFPAHVNKLRSLALSSMGLAMLVDVGALTIDRHNVEAPEKITHHHVLRWKARKQARICAHMRVTTRGGKPLHVFNTHLSLPTPFASDFWKLKNKMGYGVNQLHEAKTLAAYVQRQAGAEPFVVCGDFNSPPGSPVYRYLTEEVGFVGAQAALKQIDGKSAREFPTAGLLRLRMHLDHLFGGNGVQWLDLEGTLPFGHKESPFAGRSDHMPLIARVRVP
jgi:endonuclease/exonuclease/phosphatase family metal-dependent hydrolase